MQSLTIERVTNESEDLPLVLSLYEQAFPKNERRPLTALLNNNSEYGAVWAVYDHEKFAGLVSTLTYGDVCHIIYFAVKKSKRNKGYGSDILAIIKKELPDKRIIVDVEVKTEEAENNDLRARRRKFYLRNGYQETGIKYEWHGDMFEILVCGGQFSLEDWNYFWDGLEKDAPELVNY